MSKSHPKSQSYSSSSSPPSSSFFSAALAFFLFTRPGRPPPNGEVRAKSICFWESRRTMNEGTLTICFPTLQRCKSGKLPQYTIYPPNMPLLDQNTSMMNTLCKTELVDTCLQPTLQKVLKLQSQYIIEFHAGLVEHTDPDKTTNQRISFEKTFGVFFVERQKLTVNLISQVSRD